MEDLYIKNIESFKKNIGKRIDNLEELFHNSKRNEQEEFNIYKKTIKNQISSELKELKDDLEFKFNKRIENYERKITGLEKKLETNLKILEEVKTVSQEFLKNNNIKELLSLDFNEYKTRLDNVEKDLKVFKELIE